MSSDNVTFTPEMIDIVQKIIKKASYDGDKFEVSLYDSGEVAPCTVTQTFFPDIIDMALEHLKRKASYSLVEWVDKVPKTSNIEYKNSKLKLKNKLLPVFDWGLVSK